MTDAGSGVDPTSLRATVDGQPEVVRLVGNRARVSLGLVRPGTHKLVVTVAD